VARRRKELVVTAAFRAADGAACRNRLQGGNKPVMEIDRVDVETPRLTLRVLRPAALRALLEGDRAAASRVAGCNLLSFPDDQLSIAGIRLRDLEADPDYLPWSLRAMALKPDLRFVGHFNFHTKPNADYLQELAPGAVEMGYFVLPEFRRRGLAEEAALGMMDWAARTRAVTRFVVSIGPDNAASVAMARKLGFARIGSHIDEEDGYEDILARDAPR
jgi:RimJ/RimL family protein N-acetyltransferase